MSVSKLRSGAHIPKWLANTRSLSGGGYVSHEPDIEGTLTTDGGNVTRITRPDGSFLAYSYDAAHRPVRVSDALDERIDYTLDAMGNRTLEQISTAGGAAVAKTQSRVFDELGWLLQSIGAAGQTNSISIVSLKYPGAVGQHSPSFPYYPPPRP